MPGRDTPRLALLAGGLATRLRPLTEKMPKSLISVGGAPFIAHQLEMIRAEGIDEVVICAGHMWEQIRDFVGDGSAFGLAVDYSLDGEKSLGTGGALVKALPKLGPEFFVMYGDSYLPTRFAPVLDYFRNTQAAALMTVFRNEGQWDRSNVAFVHGKIRAYDKKNQSLDMHYIDYGLGLFHAGAFAAYAYGGAVDLADVYQDLLAQGRLAGYEVRERFYEIGSHHGIRETDELLSRRTGT